MQAMRGIEGRQSPVQAQATSPPRFKHSASIAGACFKSLMQHARQHASMPKSARKNRGVEAGTTYALTMLPSMSYLLVRSWQLAVNRVNIFTFFDSGVFIGASACSLALTGAEELRTRIRQAESFASSTFRTLATAAIGGAASILSLTILKNPANDFEIDRFILSTSVGAFVIAIIATFAEAFRGVKKKITGTVTQ
ncbi:hypothetical protein HY992_01035 [Candidatus Micrarchaeota archaeon]|nr:hypothetical protein [Candidatus Micrarchaeota archaeon]